jgi:hypothetical protein
MMGKWSVKPASDNAARLRNNQRRHRKRRKDYVEELESRLAETQRQLDQALLRITELSEDLSRAQSGTAVLEGHHPPQEASTTGSETVTEARSWQSFDYRSKGSEEHDIQSFHISSWREEDSTRQPRADVNTGLSFPDDASSWGLAPFIPDSRTSNVAMQEHAIHFEVFEDMGNQECCSLPLPEEGRSTTRCRDAFLVISQQNHKAVDISIIREWLEPGFRRPFSEGDGCRVDTVLLFTLLDWISSP